MLMRFLLLSGLVCGFFSPPVLQANLQLEGFDYPFEMKNVRLYSQQQELEMAYAEVPPSKKEIGTVVLLHGKNFGGFYWKETADALSNAGFRVIIPDQIGFGKSTKPLTYQYSLHQLADNTRTLVQRLGHRKVHLVGHSMGGMIAVRHSLMFPEEIESLTLVNPIGLEDWKAKGVPYQPIDAWYQQELKQTPESLRAYQTENYFDGQWKDTYDTFIRMFDTFRRHADYPRYAWNQALTHDMIFTQPVCHEFPQLSQPVLLIIGQRDRTAPGRDRAPEEIRDSLGNYPELGRNAYQLIPKSQLVELQGVGHLPHIEAFPGFIEPLIKFLRKPSWDKKKKQ